LRDSLKKQKHVKMCRCIIGYGPQLAPEPPKMAPPARLKEIDRNQSYWGAVAIEELIPADHLARAIWDLTEKLDFSGFLKDNKSVEGKPGRER
jgi:hypothetical protein